MYFRYFRITNYVSLEPFILVINLNDYDIFSTLFCLDVNVLES